MSRTDWPKRCSIAEAARLFSDAGHKIDRSNLSRWIDDRDFPGEQQGKRIVYDPDALFAAWSQDFGRQVMAGQTGGAAQVAPARPPEAASASQSAPREPVDDPKRDLARVQARTAQLDLEARLGRTLSAEEVAAGMAEALAQMRAAFSRVARAEAKKMVADLKLPGNLEGAVAAGLKRFALLGQEAWAESAAELLQASSTPGTPANQRLAALIAYDLQLRGETDVETREPALQPN